MVKPKGVVVARFPYAAVKKTETNEGLTSFDVWQWNIFKMKWVRMSNTACGYGRLGDATPTAKEISEEIETAIKNNITAPEPLS